MEQTQYESAKKSLNEISAELKRTDLSEDERQRLKILQAQLSGSLLSVWIPFGVARRIVMALLILTGIYGLLTGNYILAAAFIFAALFSPRIIGETAFWLGKLSR